MPRPETTRGEDTNMENMINKMRALVRDDNGQDLIEYALLAGLISLVAVAAITTAGTHVNGIFTKIGSQLATANK
jgi:pilus assembly protein Flp/PilA